MQISRDTAISMDNNIVITVMSADHLSPFTVRRQCIAKWTTVHDVG